MSKTKTLSREQVKQRNDAIRDYFRSNQDKMFGEYAATAKLFNTTPDSVNHLARRMRAELNVTDAAEVTPKIEFKITQEVEVRRENAQIKSLKKQLEESIKEYEKVSDALDVALNIKTQDVSNNHIPIIEGNSKINNEATAIIQISDAHFGKIILPSTVNGLNSYNPDIARKRMDKLAENTIKLIKKERNDVKIDNLILVLGGDFIENSQLHEHSEMSTSMSPLEEVLFTREILNKFIKTVADNGDFKKIVVPCTRGNHSRHTKKMVAGLDYRLNYEGMIYKILEQDFSDSRFTWYAPDSEITEFELYGRPMRAFHGERIRFQGGVGGLTIPLNKFIMRMDQIKPAHYNFMGHYHNYSFPTSKCTLNGSVCGLDAYAFGLGCEYQPAMQSFQLFDKKRGMTVRVPIFCD